MKRGLLLKRTTIVTPDGSFEGDVRVRGGRIQVIGDRLKVEKGELVLDCSSQTVYPGLINSHDHLAFNLYPRLGTPPYENAYEWGNDIHARCGKVIESIQRIPDHTRLAWGAWKNLFSGVTRVVHHDAYSHRFRFHFPVDVLRKYTFAHSMRFDPDLKLALSRRKPGVPFLIHLAEGKDESAAQEVRSLRDMGGLDDRTVAVHAVGVDEEGIKILSESGASIIWCPSSNLYLFGHTAPVDKLRGKVPLALGTDSTLTGPATLFEELRTAKEHSSLSSREIFSLVTENPRKIFGFSRDAGTLAAGGRADFFVASTKSGDPYEDLLSTHPGDISLMVKGGRVVFLDPSVFSIPIHDASSRIMLDGKVKIIRGKGFSRLYSRVMHLVDHYSYLRPV